MEDLIGACGTVPCAGCPPCPLTECPPCPFSGDCVYDRSPSSPRTDYTTAETENSRQSDNWQWPDAGGPEPPRRVSTRAGTAQSRSLDVGGIRPVSRSAGHRHGVPSTLSTGRSGDGSRDLRVDEVRPVSDDFSSRSSGDSGLRSPDNSRDHRNSGNIDGDLQPIGGRLRWVEKFEKGPDAGVVFERAPPDYRPPRKETYNYGIGGYGNVPLGRPSADWYSPPNQTHRP
jgi:hypothetical protein